MPKRILILNLALLLLLVLGVVKLRKDWKAFAPAHDVARIQPAAQAFPSLPVAASSAATAGDWTDIPAHNAFSFDRTDIDVVAQVAPPAEPPKPLSPKPVLFGTIFLDKTHQMALLASGPSGRAYREFKVGEAIDGWNVVEIQTKSVVVESQGVRDTVIMNDPSAKIPREVVRTAAVAAASNVVSGVSGPASPSTVSSNAPAVSGSAAPPAPGQAPADFSDARVLFGGKSK